MMKGKTAWGTIAYWLVLIGAINWGLVGLGYLFGGYWNVVYLLLGQWPMIENVVYMLVGLSAISMLFGCKKSCICGSEMQ